MSTIYIHWPFCISKCAYCDFNSVPCLSSIDYHLWLQLYKKITNLHVLEFYKGEEITSVYFGGGTPSLLPVWFVSNLLDFIHQNFILSGYPEITLEANPKTIDLRKARDLKEAGVNRISLGIQSLIDQDLKMLGRIHNSFEAIETLHMLLEVFDNVSIDMIYNRPGQTLDSWLSELKNVLELPVHHMSLYELIVEEGTPIQKQISSGQLPKPSSSEDFITQTWKMCESAGFKHYEISNFAKSKEYQSKHNMSYWKYDDYYGIGPGSHSRVSKDSQKIAIAQIPNNNAWIDWASSNSPLFDLEHLSKYDEFAERLIMGLRASCGVFISSISQDIQVMYNLHQKIKKLESNGDAIFGNDRLTLTPQGLLRINKIVEYLTS